jgi:thioredoxin-related protein
MLTFAARGVNIKIYFEGIRRDTVFLQAFSEDGQWKNAKVSTPAKNCEILYDNKSISPGFYCLSGKYFDPVFFIISDDKSQDFEVIIKKDTRTPDKTVITYIRSEENTANQRYIEQMDSLDAVAKSSRMALQQLYAIPARVDTAKITAILQVAQEIDSRKRQIRETVIAAYPRTLLSSLVRMSEEMPAPPENCYHDKTAMEQHIATHFFDYMPWEDSRIYATPVFYNKMLHFISLLHQFSPEQGALFLQNTLSFLHDYPTSYMQVCLFLNKKMGPPGYPMWHERACIIVLKDMLLHASLTEKEKKYYTDMLHLLDQNHPGSTVPDIPLLLSTGDTSSLKNIKANYMLLYLQHPECHSCISVKEKMLANTYLTQMIDSNKIQVLTLYFENDRSVWERFVAEAPAHFLHAWDYQEKIEKEHLFDTRAIPVIFLLDKDKKIIVKDLQDNELESILRFSIDGIEAD